MNFIKNQYFHLRVFKLQIEASSIECSWQKVMREKSKMLPLGLFLSVLCFFSCFCVLTLLFPAHRFGLLGLVLITKNGNTYSLQGAGCLCACTYTYLTGLDGVGKLIGFPLGPRNGTCELKVCVFPIRVITNAACTLLCDGFYCKFSAQCNC